MSVRNVNYLLNPSSIAVVGASNREFSVGAVVMHKELLNNSCPRSQGSRQMADSMSWRGNVQKNMP